MNCKATDVLREITAALAMVFSIVFLACQVGKRKRLTRVEANRPADSELNSLNAAFSKDPVFSHAVWKVVEGASRDELEEDERSILDYYMVSIATVYERLSREVREGMLDQTALDFRGKGVFSLPYFRSSWPLYRDYLNSKFANEFEKQIELDPSIEASW